VVFMALSPTPRPHFTTLAGFVRRWEKEIVALFRDVLLYCEELGLLGKEHSPSTDASCPRTPPSSGAARTRSCGERQQKMEQAARQIVRRHHQRDEREQHGPVAEQDENKLATYRRRSRRSRRFSRAREEHRSERQLAQEQHY